MSTEQRFTVSGLNEYVSGLLAADPFLTDLTVEGEITGFKRHTSGHLYFSLKDANALVRCVMFRQQALKLNFLPRDGMQVTLKGYASLFQRDGSFQLYAKSMEKQGQGDLYRRFLALKAELEEKGFFDPDRKRPIPVLPKCVGIVTSDTGAALQDILNIMKRRFPLMDVCICPARVQGEGAAAEIASGIRRMNKAGQADVLIVGRGGGSMEDLWAFNEPEVAQAIFESRIPIISAVGHETDFTIADFVADLRAPTPSAAAELAVPEYEACRNLIQNQRRRIVRALSADLQAKKDGLRLIGLSAGMQLPKRKLDAARQDLANLQDRILEAPKLKLLSHKERLTLIKARLEALGPNQVLRRGYAYLSNEKGRAVSSVGDLSSGEGFIAHLSDGTIQATVKQIFHRKS
ncbi:MAG: exodeoxyribonuclease VII large subunit [Clostridia bacterium]|nr:exodeoxyribonuclease VII large subunit [Clostridia bacterium]